MSVRAQRLHEMARTQVATLERQLRVADGSRLLKPCPGRGRLGDGTIAAVAGHTADRYEDIARFIAGSPTNVLARDAAQRHHPPADPLDAAGLLNRRPLERRSQPSAS